MLKDKKQNSISLLAISLGQITHTHTLKSETLSKEEEEGETRRGEGRRRLHPSAFQAYSLAFLAISSKHSFTQAFKSYLNPRLCMLGCARVINEEV